MTNYLNGKITKYTSQVDVYKSNAPRAYNKNVVFNVPNISIPIMKIKNHKHKKPVRFSKCKVY